MNVWTACLVAFLLGSIPFGVIVARAFKVTDLTRRGSGNIGATNVSRVVGFWPAGAITFALDVLKGTLPVFLASPAGVAWIAPMIGLDATHLPEFFPWAVGLSAVLGHCFTPWLRFKGGKGVATGFGVIVVLSPWAALAGIVAFSLAFLARRVGSLSSLVGLSVAAVAELVFEPLGPHLLLGAAIIVLIVYRHESNIDALLAGSENRF
jgi:glycerol-3-phosphate acyltransferase PlsY